LHDYCKQENLSSRHISGIKKMKFLAMCLPEDTLDVEWTIKNETLSRFQAFKLNADHQRAEKVAQGSFYTASPDH